MNKCTCNTSTPCIVTCEWCSEEFRHGFPAHHNDRIHREDWLRIREVRALEKIAELLARRAV